MKRNKSKSPFTVAAILVAIALCFAVASGYFYARAMEATADVVYEMTNKNITWTGAGYNGIYGGSGK